MKDNRPKPDDRRDNVDKIQFSIDQTIENMEQAEEDMIISDDPQQIKDLKEKNVRRQGALDNFRSEIRDEAEAKERNYK